MPASSKKSANTVINLLILLNTKGGAVAREEACRILGVRDGALDEALDIINSLANRESGARAVVVDDGETLTRLGHSADLAPIRLTIDEGLILSQVMTDVGLDETLRQRVADALLPLGIAPTRDARVADTTHYGPYYQRLSEAVADGIRCRIVYRSDREPAPTTRTIDPLRVRVETGISYLDAWDVERDAQRRYRLDRITQVSFTEDSADRHTWDRAGLAESLKRDGQIATLAFPSERHAHMRDWSGMGDVVTVREGLALASVAYTNEAWLFDQVLEGAGEIQIIAPLELRERLRDYAAALLTA